MENKIFVIGDLHGGTNGELRYLDMANFKEQSSLTKDDVVIQLGDFGLVWYYKESINEYKKDLRVCEEIAARKFTLLVVPGNHENYDIINNLPIIEKWGGKVYELVTKRGSIYFTVRGEIYTINGKKIFTFSGATSAAEEGRYSFEKYLSKEKVRKKKYRYDVHIKTIVEPIKLKEINYWPQELSTQEEKDYAMENLYKHNLNVDYILAHTAPTHVVENSLWNTKENASKFECSTVKFLDQVYDMVTFKEWHYGHLHNNIELTEEDILFQCHYKTKPIEIT